MSIFNSFTKLNNQEKSKNQYYLTNNSLALLDELLDKGVVRFPTTFIEGLLNPFKKIVGNEILRRILNIELHPDSRRTIMVKRIVS